jgi:hypothetical protein
VLCVGLGKFVRAEWVDGIVYLAVMDTKTLLPQNSRPSKCSCSNPGIECAFLASENQNVLLVESATLVRVSFECQKKNLLCV